MKRKIKAIETLFNGVYYRSRLEARWQIWFDAMNVRANYEQAGYDLGGVWYLPDFFIPEWSAHIEIKPEHLMQEESERLCKIRNKWEKAEGLSVLMIIQGLPALGRYTVIHNGMAGYPLVFADCRRCEGITFVGWSTWGNLGRHNKECWLKNEREGDLKGDRIMDGYMRAMSAKFEHKDTP